MDLIQYDKETAAIHELGHATIACIAKLAFEYVEIRVDSKVEWAGQCKLVSLDQLSQIEQDGFQMGGPLMQIIYRKDSLREFELDFAESIFEHAQLMSWPNDERLRKLSWQSDLYDKNIMLAARILKNSTPALRHRLERHWLFTLEARIRDVFRTAPIKAFVDVITAILVEGRSVESKVVRQYFDDTVPPEVYSDLIQFIKEHKDS